MSVSITSLVSRIPAMRMFANYQLYWATLAVKITRRDSRVTSIRVYNYLRGAYENVRYTFTDSTFFEFIAFIVEGDFPSTTVDLSGVEWLELTEEQAIRPVSPLVVAVQDANTIEFRFECDGLSTKYHRPTISPPTPWAIVVDDPPAAPITFPTLPTQPQLQLKQARCTLYIRPVEGETAYVKVGAVTPPDVQPIKVLRLEFTDENGNVLYRADIEAGVYYVEVIT